MTSQHRIELAVPALQRSVAGPLLFVAIVIVVSLPLLFNDGYYAHDELQWLAAADQPSWSDLPWQGWWDFSPFQYRPLTFNSWLILSRCWGYSPQLMHAAVLLLAWCNAWLLRSCLLVADVPARTASIAAALFVLSPHAVQVHGWVGTLGDLFVLLCALLTLRVLQQRLRRGVELAAIAGLTILALWSKESAIVFPALLLALWPWRRWTLMPALLVSAAVVTIYLALRLNIILYAPRAETSYAWALSNIAVRLFDYAAFPFSLGVDEVHVIRMGRSPWRWIIGFSIAVGVCIAVASIGLRWLAAFLVGWIVCLGPVLLLSSSAAVYAYLSSAWAVAVCAAAWPSLRRTARVMIVVAAVVATAHGAQLAQRLRHVGTMQAGLFAALEPLLPHASVEQPLRITTADASDLPHLQRVLHQVPSWKRIALAGRVVVVESTEAPSYRLQRNGQLNTISSDSR